MVPASLMRGGTSKGLYFLSKDVPDNKDDLTKFLLAAMGSPDERQIDGVGGGHPLTSKVAIVGPSTHKDADIDYLFLQVFVDKAEVSDTQNCGNILAGVGPFAIEQGLITPQDDFTDVRIYMVNTGALAVARVETPAGKVNYEGSASIDGVPGTSAPVLIDFLDVAGSSCGSLFSTGNSMDFIRDTPVTCIDNGMPVVLIRASDLGITGNESPAELEANDELKAKVESIRFKAGEIMNLGDVTNKTIPKISLISPPSMGGVVNTRTFIPQRVHEAIGVLGSVSVATACMLKGTVASDYVERAQTDGTFSVKVEHPTGAFIVEMEIEDSADIANFKVVRSALLRTARLLMRGEVFVVDEALA